MVKIQIRFIILLSLSALLLLLYISGIINFSSEIDRRILLKKIELDIASESDTLLCKPPSLEVYSPEIMKFIHKVPPIDCEKAGINWVKCKSSICSIQEEAKLLHGDIECRITDLIREDDFKNVPGKSTITKDVYHLVESDLVKVECWSSSKKWSTVLTGVRKSDRIWKETNWDKVPQEALKMNVLMFGVDSVSRNLFVRKLPKTHDYITKTLGGVVLEGYNIVGDGTPQALIPILTGKTELELPDTRKRFSNTEFVNSYPFIWNEFKNAGYVTGYLEDLPSTGIFTYRLNGFKEVPTDHYMRPYYLEEASEYKKWPKYCTANTPRHQVMTNLIKDFFQVYRAKPKFLFGFHGELSHDDYNLVGAADLDFKEFLTDLYESNMLNNTILMIFADHGHRFAAIRNTLQGKQEERLPFFSITLPKWFQRKYPEMHKALRKNTKRLATPFDIHATLKTVLNQTWDRNENGTSRSLSLFSEIPEDRTCSKAFIEPHWCACLAWQPLEKSSELVGKLSRILVDTLNNYTSSYRNLCDLWEIKKINWASKLTPNEKLVKFKQNADKDGFLADLSDDTRVLTDTFQISVEMNPDGALFESSITHNLEKNNFILRMSDISRINMYGKQARCIEVDYPHLRKYCHCKD